MAKNQKRPTILSMGGIMPKNNDVSKPSLPVTKVQIPKTEASPKPQKVEKTRKGSKTSFLRRITSGKFWLRTVLSVLIASLYVFDINKFPPLLPGKIENFSSSADIGSIAYLPAKAILIALNKLHESQYNIRYLSISIMLLAVFCFYKFMSTWVSKRMSVLSTLLFACSSWALFWTRQGSVSTMQLALVPAVLYLGWQILYSKSRLIKFISAILLAQFIFVPGGVWFIFFSTFTAIYISRKSSFKFFILPAVGFILALAAYAGLIFYWSLSSQQPLITLAGSELGSLAPLNAIRTNILDLPGQLFYSGLNDSSAWLKSTPIIDWISALLLIAGLASLYKTKFYPIKKKIITLFLAFTLILVFINGVTYVSLLLPVVYIVIGLGITYLADQWMAIFPNNPLARGLGLVIVGLVVFAACFFHLERYFIGWPNTEEYHQIYKG